MKVLKNQFIWKKGETASFLVFVTKGHLTLLCENKFGHLVKKPRENLTNDPNLLLK